MSGLLCGGWLAEDSLHHVSKHVAKSRGEVAQRSAFSEVRGKGCGDGAFGYRISNREMLR